jgi:uncharacterized membrane protein YagU involved in acid resistance
MRKRNGRTNGRTNGSLATDMMKGAIGGAIGVWVMDRVGWDMYLSEDPKAFQQEKEAQVEGKYAAHVMVGHAAEAVGKELTETQQHKAGKAMHYGLGIMPGALYGALRHRVPTVATGSGLVYGLGMFVMEDEITNPLLGNTSGPMAYPWQAHARGLVTHLVLGAVTETVCSALDEIM